MSETPTRTRKQEWHWLPPVPLDLDDSVYFAWPPRPVAVVRHLLGTGYLLSTHSLYILLAIASWAILGPAERWATLEFDWIAQTYLINFGLVVAIGGGLHLYFYTFARQGMERKFNPAPQAKNNPRFFTGDQVHDNIFWTCVSGVTVTTVFQVGIMWAYAHGVVSWLDWASNPIWFVLLFPLLNLWESMHFYFVHRFLHWKPLYKVAHALHHRNVNTGPWSGLSMHPIEHLLYFSTIVIHFLVASHPIHMMYHMFYTAGAALTDHTGYDSLLVKGKRVVPLSGFFHQLHHRYFDCNYGTKQMPWDRWFGSYHDGTPEGTENVRAHQARLRGGTTQTS